VQFSQNLRHVDDVYNRLRRFVTSPCQRVPLCNPRRGILAAKIFACEKSCRALACPTPRGRAINSAPVHRFSADRKCFVATAAPKRPETPPSLSVSRQIFRHRFRCIAIHALKSYQRLFGQFWRGKPWISSSSRVKRAEGVWGGAVNGCYGKYVRFRACGAYLQLKIEVCPVLFMVDLL